MGLLLSIFEICLGVFEFLAVYANFQENLQFVTSSRDLSPLVQRYEEGLRRERCRILKIIEEQRKHEQINSKDEKQSKQTRARIDLIEETTILNVTEIKTEYIFPKENACLSTNEAQLKFGLSLDELEPDWSRSPSPLLKDLKFANSPLLKKALINNFQSSQNTNLNESTVGANCCQPPPPPFKDFLESTENTQEKSWDATRKAVSSEEDEEKPFYGEDFLSALNGIHHISSDFLIYDKHSEAAYSWNPNKPTLSSDEENGYPSKLDEHFMHTLDGLSKVDDKRRSFRQKKLRRSQSSSLEVKQKSIDVVTQETVTNVEENVEKNAVVIHDKKQFEVVDEKQFSDDELSYKERNSASRAFWLIFSGEYTKAMNKDWHGQHFCCWQCDESLTGQRYVLRDEHPYCVACYESVFANSCEKCSKTIGIDSKDLSYKDKHWHEACFLCATCSDSLVDKQFGSKGDRIYCGRCYDEQFASRCDGCGQIFRAGTKKMEYKTRQWHEKCFCCCVCKTPIGTQSFIPREQEIYCAKCYEEKYATRCIKCNKVITSGGVTYKNEPWHRECFTCTHCNTSLAGARFTSRDDKPYCAECFGELFAKRCTACNKPITGIGGTKFISFEDRHWHNDCFFCASCRTSLVGRGFITDGDDIICPECAKQKLM